MNQPPDETPASPGAPAARLAAWSEAVSRLDRALARVVRAAAAIGVAPPTGAEWYELLRHKLVPQLSGEPVVVAAVVGGTNLGKSALFNTLIGEPASGVSPLAAGTRHPVCVAPPDAAREEILSRLFEGFNLRPWRSSDDPLSTDEEDWLFWRVGRDAPPRLLTLDTPDIDSDVEVNWRRADRVRQAADVLVAVLTQQKYNDAAVKRFFRKAAEADKSVYVVFNQVDMAQDAAYWPLWLETFTTETHARPEGVFVVPYDRAAAAERRLATFDVGRDGRSPPRAASLRDELANLRFEAIKRRALAGAVAGVVDPARGARVYLDRVRAASGDFAAASRTLSAAGTARVSWPVIPSAVLVEQIRLWWDEHRKPWSRQVHGFYRKVGTTLAWPLRAAWRAGGGVANDPLATFQARERAAVIEAVERLIDELERLSTSGNETLRPRLAALLAGAARERLLERVRAAHAALPALNDSYREFLRRELDRWGAENPKVIAFLQSLDHVAALARPAITVMLAVSGGLVAGDVVGQVAAHAASQTATHVATEAAIAGGITVGGEAVVNVAGEGIQQAAARLFRRLQAGYAESRAAWLAEWLGREFLGGLIDELNTGGGLAETADFREAETALAALSRLV